MKTLCILLALLAACLAAEARLMQLMTPKQLCEKADFVIIGTPVTIEKTTEQGVIRLGEKNPAYPSIGYVAKLKVNHVICTTREERLSEEIVFRYSDIDFTQVRGVTNGPERIYLEPNVQYIIYLKKDPKHEGGYIGALEGEFDDGQTVIRVLPREKKVATPSTEPVEAKP